MKLIDPTGQPSYCPPLHFDLAARDVISRAVGASNVSVALTEIEPGGGADTDVHPDSEHIFFMLEGELTFYSGQEEVTLTRGKGLFIAPGEPHSSRNNGRGKGAYLVITSPPIKKDWSRDR
ncbi:MAG: cupin domain-containing protein [Chloroflexi bacterium]|nr:cupin domain-containing protein [Chloroflexota bacterium]